MNKKLGNPEQLISAYELKFDAGSADGKKVILVHNGGMEMMFSKDNALDILYLKYNGKNISFLSKNGINDNRGTFINRFEAGFLYTCGMDNISDLNSDKPMHGSLHITKAENVKITTTEDAVIVEGVVKETALFGKNLALYRRFTVKSDSVEINDTMVNEAFVDSDYVMLYHVNFGYPFLDESLEIKMNLSKSEGRTPYAVQGLKDQFIITAPVDGGEEQCFYNYSKDGVVDLINKKLGVSCQMVYGLDTLPYQVEWKSMVSGDYALGIEPATALFNNFKMMPIKAGEKKNFSIKLNFSQI
ncbi:MAG: DUF4432 family protein [Clostridia bacterium]|nr:DUF4432 family protein [Clostridia bacterium]